MIFEYNNIIDCISIQKSIGKHRHPKLSNHTTKKYLMKRSRDENEGLEEQQIEKKYIVGKDQDNNLITQKVKTKKKNKDKLKKKQETNTQQIRTSDGKEKDAIIQDKISKMKTTEKSEEQQKSDKKAKKKKNKQKQVVDQKQKVSQHKQKPKQNGSQKENNQERQQDTIEKQKKKKKHKKESKQTSKQQQMPQKDVQKHPNQKLRPSIISKPQNQGSHIQKKKKSKKSKKEKAERQIFDQQEAPNQQQNQSEVKMEFSDNRSQYSAASTLPMSKVESQQSKKKDKSGKKSKKQQKTINETNRQMAKQCITQKSNFYLHKQDMIRMGLPVGRGSRKQQESMLAQRKKIKNEHIKINKLRRKAFLQSKQGSNGSQASKAKSKDESLAKYKSQKIKKDDCTKEESFRIINEFEKDAGDYKCLVKILGYPLVKIRSHLRTLFEYCIAIISGKVIENGMKISDWQLIEKREIIRQLHRIRCTNRLLSEQNVEFRQKFHKLMKSYNDPNVTLQNNDYNYLYRKIEAFVRGYCTLGAKKKQEVKTQDSFQLNRPPLLEGGYILDKNRVKREVKTEVKLQQKKDEEQQKKIDLDKIIYDWNEQQQRTLSQFYIQNHSNFDYIIDQLTLKFGKKNRWKDFQILGRKVDHLVKLGLLKIQQLTSRPYNREQRYKQEQEKNRNKAKLIDPSSVRSEVNSLDLLTQFIYNNKKVLNKPSDTYENGVFQNPSLLQRQIFGHVESYKVRIGLVGLMRQKFPSQQQIDKVIKVAHQFMTWAQDWQQKNGIIQIKNKNLLNPKIKSKATTVKQTLSQESLDNNPNQFQDLIFELNDFQPTEKMDQGSAYGQSDMFAIEQNTLEDEIMRQS